MHTSPARLFQFFDGEKQNVVPAFQRQYSWRTDNWRMLWSDILDIYEERKESPERGDDNSLFMGAVVTMPVTTVPVGVSKHLIIDGQQRLTTFALLLIAIREISSSQRQDQINNYLVNSYYEEPDRLKIIPTSRNEDRSTFSDLVDKQSISGLKSHPMVDAVNFFKSCLQGKDLADAPINVDQMFDIVRTCLKVVSINLSDKDDPYLIFESLNYKGEPLSAADLVRNYTLMRFRNEAGAGGEQENTYKYVWQPLEKRLTLTEITKDGKESTKSYLTDFLSHYLAAHGLNAKRGKIYTFFKRHMDPMQSVEEVKERLSIIGEWGSYYERFIKPDTEANSVVRKHLQALVDLKISTPYPLLLVLFALERDGSLDFDSFCYSLEMIESFVVRRFICNLPTNSLARMFDKWAADLDKNNPVEWLATSLLSGSGNRKWPRNDDVRTAVQGESIYGKNICRFLLEAIERSYGKEVVDLKDSRISIEHIMPQTLSVTWKNLLGEESERIHSRLLHNLGNLSLTAYNPELSNSPFHEKRLILKESNITLNKWISEQSTWGRDQIEERAEKLLEIIVNLWRIPVKS